MNSYTKRLMLGAALIATSAVSPLRSFGHEEELLKLFPSQVIPFSNKTLANVPYKTGFRIYELDFEQASSSGTTWFSGVLVKNSSTNSFVLGPLDMDTLWTIVTSNNLRIVDLEQNTSVGVNTNQRLFAVVEVKGTNTPNTYWWVDKTENEIRKLLKDNNARPLDIEYSRHRVKNGKVEHLFHVIALPYNGNRKFAFGVRQSRDQVVAASKVRGQCLVHIGREGLIANESGEFNYITVSSKELTSEVIFDQPSVAAITSYAKSKGRRVADLEATPKFHPGWTANYSAVLVTARKPLILEKGPIAIEVSKGR